MSVSTRCQRIADSSTQSGVFLCGYSLMRIVTPVCCLEAVMAAVAAAVTVCGVIVIVDRFDVLHFTLCR